MNSTKQMTKDITKDKIHFIALSRLMIGTAGGLATIILCILGLVHIASTLMVSLATLTIGFTLFFKGVFVSGDYYKLYHQLSDFALDQNDLIGGISIELLAAIASIILGTLSVFYDSSATIMIAIAALINGASFIIDSTAIARVHTLKMNVLGHNPGSRRIAEEMISAAMAIPVLIGISVIVMAILSLIGILPLIFNLVSLLAIAGCSLLMGTVITGRMLTMLQIIHSTNVQVPKVPEAESTTA